MNLNICNNCGGDYEYRYGRWVCRFCGSYKPEEISNEEVTLLYTAYQKLRLAEFSDAEIEFDDIIEKYPRNPNAYWGRLMAKYGIKYEQDFDGRMIPTCYAASIESILSAQDYQKALQFADDENKAYYKGQAEYIERVRKEWIEKARKGKKQKVKKAKRKKSVLAIFLLFLIILFGIGFGVASGMFLFENLEWDQVINGVPTSQESTTTQEPQESQDPQEHQSLAYILSDDGMYYIVSSIGTCTDTDIVIPSEYNGKPVTAIGNSAFYNCINIRNISIPDSITSIGAQAFWRCYGLTSIIIPIGVKSIGDSVFYGCKSLTSITIPDSITSIGNSAFYGCSGLTEIVIPAGVTSIGDWTFQHCHKLKSISIPDSVRSIGSSAFYGCSSLTSISIPVSVTRVGDYAFSECKNLMSVTISGGVTRIDDYAFSGCSGLTSITIPTSVTSIGVGVFYSANLKTVQYMGTMEQWAAISQGSSWQYVVKRIICTDGTILP